MSLEEIAVLGSYEVQKAEGEYIKMAQEQFKEALTGQTWGNLNINMNNSDGL